MNVINNHYVLEGRASVSPVFHCTSFYVLVSIIFTELHAALLENVSPTCFRTAETLWIDPEDEDQIARVVTTWMITLEKHGCEYMVQSGAEGVLQALILSFGPLHFHNQHLEFNAHPRELHRDYMFRRINYGNNTHVNISVVLGEDNKASLFVSLDRNDKPYYACDAGCLDAPVQLR